MTIRGARKFGLVIFLAPLLAACGSSSREFDLHVEVESEGLVFHGKAKRSLRREQPLSISAETPDVVWHEEGSAAVVELGNGGALYVLLDGSDLPTATVAKIARSDDDLLQAIDQSLKSTGSRLKDYRYEERYDRFRHPYPRMVFFRDEGDPRTAELVPEGGAFVLDGRNYRVSSIWLERSDGGGGEPDILGRLPWLCSWDSKIPLTEPQIGKVQPPSIFRKNFVSR